MALFVLIPGAGGAAWYWHRVVEELAARGHRGIAVDLPAEDDSAGLPEYVEVVVSAVEAAGVSQEMLGNSHLPREASHGKREVSWGGAPAMPLVVVGQSMGGLTAPLVCDRLDVDLLVLVNAMVPRPGESGGEWWEVTGQHEARREQDRLEGRPDDADFDADTYFLHDLPPDLRAAAADHDPDQSSTPFEAPWPRDSWPDVPTRVITAESDRCFPAAFQRRIARERLGLDVDVVPGGHLVALSRPVELTERLVGYLS